MHIGPYMWLHAFNWQPQQKELWLPLWKDFRAAIKNCFLWQLLCHIPATNHWRFPLAGQTDPLTWCERCTDNQIEDILHCFWKCPGSVAVWSWINVLVQRSTPNQSSVVSLIAPEVLLGKRLLTHYKISGRWCDNIRAATIWQIWKI